MIHDKIHINSLKQKYLSEYLSKDSRAFGYIYRRLSNELENELGFNDMWDDSHNYKYDILKPACELCEHFRNPWGCWLTHGYRKDNCSLYKLSEEKFDTYWDRERRLRELIHNTIKQQHVDLYTLLQVAKKKLIKYKKAKKNETS